MDAEELLEKYGSSIDRLYDTVASADVFDRQFGSELTSWELKLHRQFQEHVTATRKLVRGFVKYTRDSSILLVTPSPWLLEGEFVYLPEGTKAPAENAYAEISGTNAVIPRLLERKQSTVRALIAEEISVQSHDITSFVSNPPKLRDLSRMLFENVGMANASKRVFTQLYVSSPPRMESIGGLTSGILAIAAKRKVNRLLRFMKGILPPSMKSPKSVSTVRDVHVDTPRLWRMETGSVGRTKMKSLCIDRHDPFGYREVSLAALTESTTAALPDVPIALANEDFWVESSNPKELRLPILKASITYQLLSPQVSQRSIDSAQSYIQERIELLRSSFGLSESALARGMILDADVQGRPLSAVRLALATARAYWKEKITAKDLKQSWDRVLEPALKEFIEIAEYKENFAREIGEGARLENYNTKIVRALKKLDSGHPGSTLEEISSESGVKKHEIALALEKMKNDGLVYEPKIGHYRLV